MGFEVIAEIEPPVGADTARLRSQIAALEPIASAILVPDNHLGRPAVSSLVVAADIVERPTIACLNARDRNLLGVRRDLLTAAHLGVGELLVLRGDDPTIGDRVGGIGVRDLVRECDDAGIAYSVTGGAGRLVDWKRGAARVFVQVAWTADELERRRERLETDLPVYAGVLVLANAAMARRLGARVPDLRPPEPLVAELEGDRFAGVRHATDLVADLQSRSAFAGVHLIAGVRLPETAAALAERLTLRIPTRAATADAPLRRTA